MKPQYQIKSNITKHLTCAHTQTKSHLWKSRTDERENTDLAKEILIMNIFLRDVQDRIKHLILYE